MSFAFMRFNSFKIYMRRVQKQKAQKKKIKCYGLTSRPSPLYITSKLETDLILKKKLIKFYRGQE